MTKGSWFAFGAVSTAVVAAALAWFMSERHESRRTVAREADATQYAVEAPDSSMPGKRLALEEALRIAVELVPGEVVKVERERDDQVEQFEIKVLTANGRVREVTLDARDGRVIDIEDD